MKMITGVDILDKEIKEKLRTENIYKIYNNFIIPLITEENGKASPYNFNKSK